MNGLDRSLSLQQLDGQEWGTSTFDSHVVAECHRLRLVPVGRLSIENLRLLIGQQIGVYYLVPLALEVLEINPFASGDYYDGDLLVAVLRVDDAFWTDHPDLHFIANMITERALLQLPFFEDLDCMDTQALTAAHRFFQRK